MQEVNTTKESLTAELKELRQHVADLQHQNKALLTKIENLKLTNNIPEIFQYVAFQGNEYLAFVDKNYVYQSINESYLRFWNKTIDQIKGHSVMEMQGKELFEQFTKPALDKAFAGETVHAQKWVNLKGKDRYMSVAYHPYTQDNVITGAIVHTKDITNIIRMEETLKESEKRFRAIFEQAAVGVAQIETLTGRFFKINQKYCDIIGYQNKEMTANTFMEITHPDDLQEDLDNMEKLKQGILREFSMEKRYFHKNGKIVWVNLTVSPMWKIGEKPTYHIAVVEEISERKQLEEQLRHSQKMDALGTLAGGIAHEFNNILGVIQGYSSALLRQLPKNRPETQHIENIHQAGNRATDLVKQILTFSRMDEQKLSTQQLPILIQEALKMVRATLPATIEVRQNIADLCSPILADPTQIHQIIMNLCTNAFHAMEKNGGVLEICLQEKQYENLPVHNLPAGSYLQLTVRDTGCGISDHIKKQIFDPFFTTKEIGKGTGLGLSVIHSIVTQYGGTITVESKKGKGATFHVYFPTVQEKIESEMQVEQQTSSPRGGRILVIDDEPTLAEIQKITLEEFGYNVTICYNSSDALEMFRKAPHQFDLIFTDYTLPELRGDQLSQEFLKTRPDIPIILTSGYSPDISIDKAKSLGIQEFMMKPIDNEKLIQIIEKLLGGKNES